MRETVLVVDDDPDVRSLYRRLLTNRGFRVLEAESIDDAFAKLAHHPHVIVLDLELPDGTSTRLLDALARDPEAPPVVLCTSSVYAARVGRRYHIPALGKFALGRIADEVARVVAEKRSPRVSRVSRTPSESRPSLS